MIEMPDVVPDLYFHADEVVGLHVLRMGHISPDARSYGNQLQYAPDAIRWASQVVWMTTDEQVSPAPAYRFKIKAGQQLWPWSAVRMLWPMDVVHELEQRPGPHPDTWWVSGGAIKVELAALVAGHV